MPITYDLENKEDHVLITAHGDFTDVDEILDYTQAFVADLLQHSVPAAILDHRDLHGDLDAINNVRIVTEYADAIQSLKSIRLAVVTTEERIASVKFLETVAQNVGVIGLAFESMEEALEWLRG